MAQYYSVSKIEMDAVLSSQKKWHCTTQGREWVYEWDIPSVPFITIKVYSGILTDSNDSRKAGADAIRVVAVNTRTGQGWIKGTRVHRVNGWCANLKARVLKVIEQSKARLR